jgi:hypothetical protein
MIKASTVTKNIKELEKLKEIIRNNRMNTSPEYYSGRGAILDDLDGMILEGIYQGILKEFGEKPANSFIKMVDDIKVLSATTFLLELYELFNRNWKFKHKRHHASGIAYQKNEDGTYNAEVSVLGIMLSLFNDRDDTRIIKEYFLSKHGVKPKKNKSKDRVFIELKEK